MFTCAQSNPSLAQEPVVTALINGSTEAISGLNWEQTEFDTTALPNAEYMATLQGEFTRPDSQLFIGKTLIKVKDGKFQFRLKSQEGKKFLTVVARNPRGDEETQKLEIQFTRRIDKPPSPTFTELPASRSSDAPIVTASIGISSHAYSETRKVDFSQTALTGKLSLLYFISAPTWDIEANTYYTLAPIVSSSSRDSVKFFGLNLRMGYTVPALNHPWSLRLAVGVTINSMIVTNNRFGYGNLIYPQIYPILRRKFGTRSLYTYLKFAPLNEGIVPKFSERELAFGGGFRQELQGGKAASLTIDFSDVLFNPRPDTTAKSSTVVIGASYSF